MGKINMYNKTDRVVIFGANGQVGSYITAHYVCCAYTNLYCVVREGCDTSVMQNVAESYGIKDIFSKINFIYADCSLFIDVLEIIQKGDIVINAAAKVSLSNTDESIIHTNIEIAYAIAQSAKEKEAKVAIQISSIATLDSSKNIVSETSVPQSILKKSLYAQSKFYSEGEFWRIHYDSTNIIIVNPSVILGIGNFDGNSSANIFKRLSKGVSFATNGVTGYVSAKDVARAVESLSQNPKAFGQRYILNGENLSYKDLINMINTQFGHPNAKYILPDNIISIASFCLKFLSKLGLKTSITHQNIKDFGKKTYYSSDKIKQLLNFEFTPIQSIVEESVKYYKKIK